MISKGPWFLGDTEKNVITYGSPGGLVLYRGNPIFRRDDCLVMAAAPELLEVLKELVQVVYVPVKLKERVSAIIDKAEGR
jgi:hypothetical protein